MKVLWLSLLIIGVAVSAYGQQADKKERMENYNLSDEGVALQGYDPVSYFKSAEPQEGSEKITYSYLGVTYYFATKDNLATFKENPGTYEPAYGGWCAYAMGDDGSKVKVDPETYKIIKGKNYLFYHTFWVNTLKKWNKDEEKLKPKADENWQVFSNNNP